MDDLMELLERSIELEKAVGRVYRLFSRLFPDDAEFWEKIAGEEDNHASLLESGREEFVKKNLFPEEILCQKKEKLAQLTARIDALLKRYEAEPPTVEEALEYAFYLEQSAGEVHFQKFTEKEDLSKSAYLFKYLIDGDKDHAERIREYAAKKDIVL